MTTSRLNTPPDFPLHEDRKQTVVDLRSDTVTRPTEAMYERMRTAPLGDDGLDGDPTVRDLEALVANKLGKQSGLYVPTTTMGNLLAVLAQTQRQEQVVLESTSHMFTTERGAATLSSLFYLGIAGVGGAMNLDALARELRRSGSLRTALVCMETTHVNAGGAVLPLAHMQAVHDLAHSQGARVHLDGARLFNAAVALNLPVDEVTRFADTVSLCLSKGLSAPAGAVLAGPRATIDHARHLRKMLGGTQRQIGVLAAAGIEAVQNMPHRLVQDHVQAQRLSLALNSISPALLQASVPATNIVMLDLMSTGHDASTWVHELGHAGVRVRAWGTQRLRLVTHRHVDAAGLDAAIAAFRKAAEKLLA